MIEDVPNERFELATALKPDIRRIVFFDSAFVAETVRTLFANELVHAKLQVTVL